MLNRLQMGFGDGRSVSLWGHEWLRAGTLRSLISGPLTREDTSLRVSNILRANGAWDLTQMSVEPPLEIREMIESTPTRIVSRNGDTKAWKFSSSGSFKTRSAYELVCGRDPVRKDSKWSWLWKTKTQPCIEFFLWVCYHRKVLVAEVLSQRGMNIPVSGSRCVNQPESVEYILGEWPSAISFWNELGIPISKKASFSISIEEWIRANCQAYEIHASNTPWSIMFP